MDLEKPIHLDCTLRDGGYYNSWDFSEELISEYLSAMEAIKVDYVELGFRSFYSVGFKGACAYTTDDFLERLDIPKSIKIAVMVDVSDLLRNKGSKESCLGKVFKTASDSRVHLVRLATHALDLEEALVIGAWLKSKGYEVALNLMQISEFSLDDISRYSSLVAESEAIDVLYFADSMGSMRPARVEEIVYAIREAWRGAIGIHTHDNLGLALENTLRAVNRGVVWVDSTVTGMGRGPGNAKTELLSQELAEISSNAIDLTKLLVLIKNHFEPLQKTYQWGTNIYYYLSGKHKIHPSYIQQMLSDTSYDQEDILSVIEHLKTKGGRSFSLSRLDSARSFYNEEALGSWSPETVLKNKDVLLLGSGPGVSNHRKQLEHFIQKRRPVVLALNTQSPFSKKLIDFRLACHPTRLIADSGEYAALNEPLITPVSMLPKNIQKSLVDCETLDFGLSVKPGKFQVDRTHCVIPSSLVVAYALAIISSGNARQVFMAGFDGFGADDPRTREMQNILAAYGVSEKAVPLISITPTRYQMKVKSIYSL